MSLTYDQYLGELSVAMSDRAMASIDGENRTLSRALLSASIVSAHWLLSDDGDVLADSIPTLGHVLRVRFAAGDVIDRDALEWVVGVCAIVLAAAYVPVDDREVVLRGVADALQLRGSLLEAASEIWSASSAVLPNSAEGVTPQLVLACQLIAEGCSLENLGVLDPLMLLVSVDKFRTFFEHVAPV